MPNISIRMHGFIDYLVGALLVGSPLVIQYPDNPMKMIAVTFGVIVFTNSLVTDYPLAIFRLVPFPIHRGVDLLAGGGLVFAPFHFAVHGVPAVLFFALGACLLLAFLTLGHFSPTAQDNPVGPGA